MLVWEAPHRLVLSWHPGWTEETAQEVAIRFAPAGSGTRVELEHRDWARLGERAAETRTRYAGGWEVVLGESFAAACAAREENR